MLHARKRSIKGSTFDAFTHTRLTYLTLANTVCVCVCVSVEGEDVDNTIAALDETLSLLQHTAIALSGLANSMVVLSCRHTYFLQYYLYLIRLNICGVCVCVCARARVCFLANSMYAFPFRLFTYDICALN